MTLLWVVDFDYPGRTHHGGILRFLRFSQELLARGHRVYIATLLSPEYREQSHEWFASLVEQNVISGFYELNYSPSSWHKRIAARAIYPGWTNRILRKLQKPVTDAVASIANTIGASLIILANRRLLFLVTSLVVPWIIDFCDCESLYLVREAGYFLSTRQYGAWLGSLKRLLTVVSEDRYYARRGTASLVVSPADHLALRRAAGRKAAIHTVMNGMNLPPARKRPVAKVPNRLVFSGNMSFPPNYTAACWFIDNVLPVIATQVPGVTFVAAGADPAECLTRRAGANVLVTGYVGDLDNEIARSALYVAPLKTGSGFKNKVGEAIANGTYVVGTSLAVEFLDAATRRLITVADSPSEMANAIIRLLNDPQWCESQVARLYAELSSRFSWAQRTDDLLAIVNECTSTK